ncbi:MAG: pseudouridine synthase, partial [Eubacteriales bacterium]|nr:pseudouridine synthase [Eubacteriales bacterium]
MRLQKFMADAGIASRRKCEEYIAEGRVKVNGNTAVIGCTVEDGDEVLFDGNPVCGKTERVAIVLNKPQGVVCTSSDPEGRRTVVDYVKELPYRLYNVGRLDYDSEGLIILTNDGDLAYKMMHPKFTVEKTYHVVCTGSLTDSDKERLEKGVALEDGLTAPAKIENIEYSQ